MPFYRKLPVEIEAYQINSKDYNGMCDIMKWCKGKLIGDDAYLFAIDTLAGTVFVDMFVDDGDYIIKGVEGEFYPCKMRIFEKTYELVGE